MADLAAYDPVLVDATLKYQRLYRGSIAYRTSAEDAKGLRSGQFIAQVCHSEAGLWLYLH